MADNGSRDGERGLVAINGDKMNIPAFVYPAAAEICDDASLASLMLNAVYEYSQSHSIRQASRHGLFELA